MDRKDKAKKPSALRPRGFVGWLLTLGFLAAAAVSAAYVFSHHLPIPGLSLTGGLNDLIGGPMGRGRKPASAESPSATVPKGSSLAVAPTAPDAPRFVGVKEAARKVWLAAEGVRDKSERVSHALEENELLRLENANLRRWATALRFECDGRRSEEATRGLAGIAVEKTGAEAGRALASIRYTPPAHLLPSQLLVLGLTYFEAREYEKAAVLLTFLTEMEGGTEFRTPRNYLLTGASWYRINNFKLADGYFQKTLGAKTVDPSQRPYQAQARLWRALTADKLKSRERTQFWLRELVDHHPQSTEAGWINPARADRVPSAAEILGKKRKRERKNPLYQPKD